MRRLYESLTGWGTIVGTALTGLALAATLIGYTVRMDAGIAHCTQAVDRLEVHTDKMGDDLTKTREDVARIEGRLAPVVKPNLQAVNEP